MKLEQLSCPACAASVSVAPQTVQAVCPYCGAALHVQRSDGEAVLLVLDRVTDAISTSQAWTTAAIDQSASATQEELRRLQYTQELSGLELQLASIQGEIRALQRMPPNKVIKKQLGELWKQQRLLVGRIVELRAILYPASQQSMSYSSASNSRGCVASSIEAVLWICFAPLVLLGKLIQSDSKVARVTGFTIAGFVLLAIALGNMNGRNSSRSFMTTSVPSQRVVVTRAVQPSTVIPPSPTVQPTPTEMEAAPVELLAAPVQVEQPTLIRSSLFPTPTPEMLSGAATGFSISTASNGAQRYQNNVIAFDVPSKWTAQMAGSKSVIISDQAHTLWIEWTEVSSGATLSAVEHRSSEAVPADAVQIVLKHLAEHFDGSGEVKSVMERPEKTISGLSVIGNAYQAFILAPETKNTSYYYIADLACGESLVCNIVYKKQGLIPYSDRDQALLNFMIGSIAFVQQ